MTTWNDIKEDTLSIPVLDHGFVRLVDVMGDDYAITDSARTSYGSGTRHVSSERNLIRHLMRNKHTSPIEMVELKFHLKMPIFVMRQHVRHRTASLNEYSGRYSVMSNEFYIPEAHRFNLQSITNKQGSSNSSLSEDIVSSLQEQISKDNDYSYEYYEYLLSTGLTRELARIQLPVSNYTELYWKIDLKNFFHYVSLRDDKHAQYEIKVFAKAMFDLIQPLFPFACEAYNDYWNPSNTHTLSRMESELLRKVIKVESISDLLFEQSGMSKREIEEFKDFLKGV